MSRRSQLTGREQHGKGREARDKGTGSGRAGYGRWEVLTSSSPNPLPPPPPPQYEEFRKCPLVFKLQWNLPHH